MGDTYYFFSDVHLGLESDEREKVKEKKLINLLGRASVDASESFIVCDLFDCWIEYKKVVPEGFYNRLINFSVLVE